MHENNSFNMLYLTDPDPRGSMGLGGKRRAVLGYASTAVQAIDCEDRQDGVAPRVAAAQRLAADC